LGGVLLLIAILSGKFKIFGAEVSKKISSVSMLFLAGVPGLFFIFPALSPGLSPAPDSDRLKPVSQSAARIVFDPPSCIRVSPSSSAAILCSVTGSSVTGTAPFALPGHNGSWYSTDVCRTLVYTQQSRVKFPEDARTIVNTDFS